MTAKVDRVTVYTTPGCQQCEITIERLTARGFTPVIVDLKDKPDTAASFKAMGLMQAPIIEVAQYWPGFQIDRINQLTN